MQGEQSRYLTLYILLKKWEIFLKAFRGSGNLLKNEDFTIEHDITVSVKTAFDFNQKKKLVRNSEKTETLYHFYMPDTFPPINWLKKKAEVLIKASWSPSARNPLTFLQPHAATSSNLCAPCKAYLGSPRGFLSNCKAVYSCSFLQDQIHNTPTWDMAILSHRLMLNPAWFGVYRQWLSSWGATAISFLFKYVIALNQLFRTELKGDKKDSLLLQHQFQVFLTYYWNLTKIRQRDVTCTSSFSSSHCEMPLVHSSAANTADSSNKRNKHNYPVKRNKDSLQAHWMQRTDEVQKELSPIYNLSFKQEEKGLTGGTAKAIKN